MLAERCGYFRTTFAESSAIIAEDLVVSFDFASLEQVTAFHHLLTFLYTDTCSLLTVGYRVTMDTVDEDAFGKAGTNRSKRKVNANDTAGTCVNSALVTDPVTRLKTIARQFDVASLVKR